ncbi:MAG: hypothetical protein AB8U69_03460 [Anaplasma ovis]|uniref:Uncharacterized protein n=1 Tax=Anaplasma ovis str. Haibei TaxID=1248439 RepID=A0A2Z2LEE1_9RICK|nr:hypothetical protein [Anaplasma ovis]ASI47655.1 hypothetical protein AOV_02105 [Anaplasma ovis str. Haibei]
MVDRINNLYEKVNKAKIPKSKAFGQLWAMSNTFRVLFPQEEVADGAMEMLTGDVAELRLGNTIALSTDMQPTCWSQNALAISASNTFSRCALLPRLKVFRVAPILSRSVRAIPIF